MNPMVPSSTPQMTRDAAITLLGLTGLMDAGDVPALLGRRGYYRDSLGKVGVNDVGIYDDALIYLSSTAFVTFNANTDPSRLAPNVAIMQPGLYYYKLGTHGLSRPPIQRYLALVQDSPVRVRRWDPRPEADREETGYFGINIHRGGLSGTSSLGCQTIVPAQWPAFIELMKLETARHQVKRIAYGLTEYAGIHEGSPLQGARP